MEPKDTWHLFYEEKAFRSVGGFITGANPLHRGHEYIHRNAMEEMDGLLIQPLVEMAKREYTRHEFRMLSYKSVRSEEHTSELQSRGHLVCRLLLEKNNQHTTPGNHRMPHAGWTR